MILFRRKTVLAFFVLDVVGLGLAFNAIGSARGIYAFSGPVLSPLIIPCLLLATALYLIDGYTLRTDMLSLEYTSQHTIAIFSAMLASLLVTFAVFPSGYPLQQSRAVIALSFLVLIPGSISYRRLFYSRYRRSRGQQSLVFLGDRASGLTFKEECALAEMTQPVIHISGTPSANTPAEKHALTFAEVLEQHRDGKLGIEAIVLCESNRDLTPEMPQQLVDLYFNGVPTYTLELFHRIYWRKIPLHRLNPVWLFQEGFEVARDPVYDRLKRISDIILSSLALVLATPVFIAAAIAIWCEDRGPIFYQQTRVGKNRKPFRVYKFRSMRQNVTGIPYAQLVDNRITKVGHFLRTSRIDEFPQILNVIKGEMSLIGPRAEWERLVADYEKQIPCYHFRHLVRPGITGWAQVNYPYGANIGDTQRKLEYDLYYIRHFSFRLDASIILKTLHVMLFGKGR